MRPEVGRGWGGEVVLVVAAAENGVIGRGGRLPWHLPQDLRRFRRLTLGHPVVMGRRTFESLGRPLEGRCNIVLSRDPAFTAPGAAVVRGLEEALAIAARGRPEGAPLFVIGGADVYRQALPLAHRIELTRVMGRPTGDAVFPDPDPRHWQRLGVEPAEGCRFETWIRREGPRRETCLPKPELGS
ncbi:MAG: dihydrofolate reductase [Sphingomonadaceae bacterium]|uniref:dihydrofolate reductase n=1 Tax=Thermaurantiacus sp. TaxID=2820283 RepID=UPI00298EF2C3|nr:dihydrofolate reductase [Thermaurantiacus sp.]MCS6987722.1 dihydrofolate reductase [Sphingomonadaceae bacterium]MDW8415058.1 dihydrofolate reductase [Thermaurantiacus sp.]